MSSLINGFYESFMNKPVNSIVHRRDPRIRALFPLMSMLAVFVSEKLAVDVLVIVLIFAMAACSKSLKRILRLSISILPFAILITAINLIMKYQLEISLVSALKFAGAVFSISMIIMLISPEEMEQIGRWLKLPKALTLLFSLSLRLLPVVLYDIREVFFIQRSRGVDFNTKNSFKIINALRSIIIPTVIVSLLRSNELTDSIIVRGFGITEKPSYCRAFHMSAYDWVFTLISVIAGGMLIFYAL